MKCRCSSGGFSGGFRFVLPGLFSTISTPDVSFGLPHLTSVSFKPTLLPYSMGKDEGK